MFPPINWNRFPQELPVTFIITATCISIWVGNLLGFWPAIVSTPGVLNWQAWLAHFSHMALFHLVSNLLMILFMGLLLEKNLGWWRYSLLVLLIWNLSVLGLVFFNPVPALGFSGIALGLMVLAYFYWQNQQQTAQFLGMLLILNLMFSFMPGVSWQAHAVGAISGLLTYGLIYFSHKNLS